MFHNQLKKALKELVFQNEEKEKRAAELVLANKELAFQNEEKEKRAAELVLANKELSFQNEEKEKRAAELVLANKELSFQNEEKENRAAELVLANKELAFQNEEKEKRAAELVLANQELAFQNEEKENRAAELVLANKELAFQNEEKEKRAAELVLANQELAFQNEEKENRAAELVLANKELSFQNEEKENRAAELVLANKELAFQNEEKENRAAELVLANKELAFQNEEKEKRAAELILANQELAFQNEEKEKRAAELILAYKELESFNFISSHDLQEPLRKIQVFTSRLITDEEQNLSDKGKRYVRRIKDAALRMQTLLIDLLAYSNTNTSLHKYENTDLTIIAKKVITGLKDKIEEKQAIIELNNLPVVNGIKFQLRQLMHNLIDNALKFSKPEITPRIIISGGLVPGNMINQKLPAEKLYSHIRLIDNGIGFDSQYNEHIFEVFKRLHNDQALTGTGIGLAIVKKIVDNHGGEITASGKLNEGVTFDIYFPAS